MIKLNLFGSAVLTIIIQISIVALAFLGFLLDPLIGVCIVVIYYIFISTSLTFYFILNRTRSGNTMAEK